jgi:hypothetical protein
LLGLPKSTEFDRRIPKQKFYENLTVTPEIKRIFVEQIKTIYWRNKIAPTTLNLAEGKTVTEIEIFEIRLEEAKLDEAVLRQIDKEVPYHIVFLLEHGGKYQAWTAYKEAASSGNNAFKVGTYYHTDWLNEGELPIKIDGLDIDKVYENFVRQIAGDILKSDKQESLQDTVLRDEKRRELKKQIANLQTKMRREKQLNKQVSLNAEIKRLRNELEEL